MVRKLEEATSHLGHLAQVQSDVALRNLPQTDQADRPRVLPPTVASWCQLLPGSSAALSSAWWLGQSDFLYHSWLPHPKGAG